MLKHAITSLAVAAVLVVPTAADAATVKSPPKPPAVSKAAKRVSKRLGNTTSSGDAGTVASNLQVGSTGTGPANDEQCGDYVNVLADALAAVANAKPPLSIDGHVSTPTAAQEQAQKDLDHVVDNVMDQGCFIVW
jgi:hypothetical protein